MSANESPYSLNEYGQTCAICSEVVRRKDPLAPNTSLSLSLKPEMPLVTLAVNIEVAMVPELEFILFLETKTLGFFNK